MDDKTDLERCLAKLRTSIVGAHNSPRGNDLFTGSRRVGSRQLTPEGEPKFTVRTLVGGIIRLTVPDEELWQQVEPELEALIRRELRRRPAGDGWEVEFYPKRLSVN